MPDRRKVWHVGGKVVARDVARRTVDHRSLGGGFGRPGLTRTLGCLLTVHCSRGRLHRGAVRLLPRLLGPRLIRAPRGQVRLRLPLRLRLTRRLGLTLLRCTVGSSRTRTLTGRVLRSRSGPVLGTLAGRVLVIRPRPVLLDGRPCGRRRPGGRRLGRGLGLRRTTVTGRTWLFGSTHSAHDSLDPSASSSTRSSGSSALRAMASRVSPSPRFMRRTPLVWRPALRT